MNDLVKPDGTLDEDKARELARLLPPLGFSIPVAGTAANMSLQFNYLPTDGEYITIGGETWTFKSSPAGDFHVEIPVSGEILDLITNWVNAITSFSAKIVAGFGASADIIYLASKELGTPGAWEITHSGGSIGYYVSPMEGGVDVEQPNDYPIRISGNTIYFWNGSGWVYASATPLT